MLNMKKTGLIIGNITRIRHGDRCCFLAK